MRHLPRPAPAKGEGIGGACDSAPIQQAGPAVAGVELVEAMLASAAGAARAREWRIYVKERGGDGKEKNVDDARSEPALLCQTSFSIDGKRKAEAREQT